MRASYPCIEVSDQNPTTHRKRQAHTHKVNVPTPPPPGISRDQNLKKKPTGAANTIPRLIDSIVNKHSNHNSNKTNLFNFGKKKKKKKDSKGRFTNTCWGQWRHQNFFFFFFFVGGHQGGKMRFWRGKNPKNYRKWLILAIFFSDWGANGGQTRQSLGRGGGGMPHAPLMPPLLGGLTQKGVFKIFNPCKGGLEKINSSKNLV